MNESDRVVLMGLLLLLVMVALGIIALPAPIARTYSLCAFTDVDQSELSAKFVMASGEVQGGQQLYWRVLVEIPGRGVVYRTYSAADVPLVWSDTPKLEALPRRPGADRDYTRIEHADIRLFVPEDAVLDAAYQIDLR